MTPELFWLTLTLVATGLMSFPYIIDRQIVRGPIRAMANDKPETGADQSMWAQRALSAHRNAVENLVVFAPAVLILTILHNETPTTALAAETYFFARLVHYFAYATGIPLVRSLAFIVGLTATFVILLRLLGVL